MSLHVDLNSVALVMVSKPVIVLCFVKIIEVLLLQPVLVPIPKWQIGLHDVFVKPLSKSTSSSSCSLYPFRPLKSHLILVLDTIQNKRHCIVFSRNLYF